MFRPMPFAIVHQVTERFLACHSFLLVNGNAWAEAGVRGGAELWGPNVSMIDHFSLKSQTFEPLL
jgi:hypothetical protein